MPVAANVVSSCSSQTEIRSYKGLAAHFFLQEKIYCSSDITEEGNLSKITDC